MDYDFHSEMVTYIRAGTPVIVVSAKEIERTIKDIVHRVLLDYQDKLSQHMNPFVWRNTTGWTRYSLSDGDVINEPLTDPDTDVFGPQVVVEDINSDEHGKNSMNILTNFHWYLGQEATGNYELIQQILDNIDGWKGRNRRTVVIVSPTYDVTLDLEGLVQHIPYKLPSREELAELLDTFIRDYCKGENPRVRKPTEAQYDAILDAAAGLTYYEFEKSISYSIIKTDAEDDRRIDAQIIMDEKVKDINKSELLTYWNPEVTMEDIGGMRELKKWSSTIKYSFKPEARDYGIRYPKGVLFLGPPGTGKTVMAKAQAGEFGLPLVRLDIGKTFGPLVGQSEQLTRNAQDQIEALAPVCVWIDEAEKGFAGSAGGGGDSGTSRRTFGSWLTWLQERPPEKIIYIIMTVNDISSLPPELMRKGRFDEIWWIDAPDEEARKQIWEIHLKKRGKLTDENQEAIYDFVKKSEKFVGAEIEACVEAAMFEAFANGLETQPNHILQAIEDVVPVFELQEKYIKQIREDYGNAVRNAAGREPGKTLDNPNDVSVTLDLG